MTGISMSTLKRENKQRTASYNIRICCAVGYQYSMIFDKTTKERRLFEHYQAVLLHLNGKPR